MVTVINATLTSSHMEAAPSSLLMVGAACYYVQSFSAGRTFKLTYGSHVTMTDRIGNRKKNELSFNQVNKQESMALERQHFPSLLQKAVYTIAPIAAGCHLKTQPVICCIIILLMLYHSSKTIHCQIYVFIHTSPPLCLFPLLIPINQG